MLRTSPMLLVPPGLLLFRLPLSHTLLKVLILKVSASQDRRLVGLVGTLVLKIIISPHTFEPRFAPTCHHCGALGHIRPRCHQFVHRKRNQDIPSQANHLSSQINQLTEMISKLTNSTSNTRKAWVKKSDLDHRYTTGAYAPH